jgi:methionyl-tRNA synthetase
MNIFIGGAWPYANGSLHIGHIAALLPGDILARYFRMKNHNVCYVSGSDCHGTPIQIRATREGVSPKQIAERYHAEFKDCFERLGFSYDLYNQTDDPYHIRFVREFFVRLAESGYIVTRTVEQAYCELCRQFLPDRFVTGKCPICGSDARGDQCDACGTLLEPASLKDTACGICGSVPIFKPSRHLFLALSRLEEFVNSFIEDSEGWRANAVGLSKRYVREGLQDRAVTRDLDWGIPVPVKGLEDKKIYVWVEAVLGYLSACKKWAEESGKDWKAFWQAGRSESEDSRSLHYYVHGKDNIPFHTVILPALLQAHGGFHLPDRILSSEYVTLGGRKISTSRNWAVWIPYLLEHYHPDSIRYFFTANGPEKRDADFSWREFINSHNGELLGAFGNFVNRSLVFIQKSFGGKVPSGQCNSAIRGALQELYPVVGKAIELGNFKDGLDAVFSFIRSANKYFDEQQPWITVRDDINKCSDTLFTCVQIIANLSILLQPYLPFSAEKIQQILGIEEHAWSFAEVPAGLPLNEVRILFQRIDKKKIREEEEKLF